MELITMDENFNSVKMVENYKSLIWTERYATSGDFQLSSNNIEETMALLPRESFVRLRDSTVPMIVEDYSLETKPKNSDAPLITVTGRSYETCLERRASVKELVSPRAAWTIPALKASDAAYLAMRVVLGDGARGTLPATVGVGGISGAPAISLLDAIPAIDLTLPADFEPVVVNRGVWSSSTAYVAGDIVTYTTGGITNTYKARSANTNVTPTTASTWDSLMIEIKTEDLYSSVLELINSNHHGIKSVLLGDGKVGIEIYNGANLTGEGSTGDPANVLVFDARFDQFDSSKYLLSQRGSTNVAYVYGSNGAQSVLKTTPDGTHPEPSGLDRRVLVVDAAGDTTLSTPEVRNSRGLVELYKYNATALYAGEVSVQVAAGYNRDYFLGDILKLTGEYAGLSENVRVAEFIRSSDSSGEKAYPTFSTVDDAA